MKRATSKAPKSPAPKKSTRLAVRSGVPPPASAATQRTRGFPVPSLGSDKHPAHKQSDDRDGYVDEEDPTPTGVRNDQPADGRSRGQADIRGHHIEAQCSAAFFGREDGGHDSRRRGEDEGAADPLDATRDDQKAPTRSKRRCRRAQAENGRPEQVVAHKSPGIGDPSHRDKEHAGDQQIRGLHPQGLCVAEMKRRAHGRQSHGDDTGIQRDHEGADRGYRKCAPAASLKLPAHGQRLRHR